MDLTITLTDTEYLATMDALREAIISLEGGLKRNRTTVQSMELEHLRTLLAQATTQAHINEAIGGTK